MFEQAFKNIDDVLRKEAGCASELDYTEQTSWLLFLKYLDGLEQDKADEAALEGKKYTFILDSPYRWEVWAAPRSPLGIIDHNKALSGDDLRDFVNLKLFPYLHGFKTKATGPNTIEYKIGEIFGEIKNRISSGYNLREIIDHIDELRFRSQTEKHELSHLYEAKIKNMGNAGRNGGEYYTPRPLIRAMVRVIEPKIGERIYDGACGSAGFLCEAFDFLKGRPGLTTRDVKTLQERTFFGKEKKSLAYVIAIMNLILHGIEAPNILHTNTLTENLADMQDRDRFDVVLANPPFGGKERAEVQQNFPIRTGETAFLFLQHFIKILKAGGRGGVIIKNTFLSNTDNASVSLRKLLLESCNLYAVLDCPGGTFQGAGVKTVVLFFEKGSQTRKTWHYQLDPGRNLGKTNPLNDADLTEFVTLQNRFADSPKSWSVDAERIDRATFDLSAKNPNGGEDVSQVQALRVLQSSTFDQAVQDGAHVFAVCAGLQLLGHRFATADGMVEGLGLLDVCSDRLPERVVGEVLATPPSSFGIAPITGFSNHAGATVLGSGVEPLAAVVQGRGNTGLTGEAEGAVQGRIVGTYLHGPVLARNPELADWLLERMCDGPLEPLAVGAPELLHAERTRVGQQPKTWRARTKAV